uniref:Putative phosphatidylglycerol/phosphatidylinositol transfer protein DDB_G0282179 n=1 Tax=Rhizophora mucronata TaxID=61149 RepID=A0A2P2JFX5_RHIMU
MLKTNFKILLLVPSNQSFDDDPSPWFIAPNNHSPSLANKMDTDKSSMR